MLYNLYPVIDQIGYLPPMYSKSWRDKAVFLQFAMLGLTIEQVGEKHLDLPYYLERCNKFHISILICCRYYQSYYSVLK